MIGTLCRWTIERRKDHDRYIRSGDTCPDCGSTPVIIYNIDEIWKCFSCWQKLGKMNPPS